MYWDAYTAFKNKEYLEFGITTTDYSLAKVLQPEASALTGADFALF